MTEQEYINVMERTSINVAQEALRNVIPKNSIVVDQDEYNFVMKCLSEWERRLFNACITTET